MKKIATTLVALSVALVSLAHKTDTISTANSQLIIHFLGHGTLMMEHGGKIIHIDPWSRVANYDSLPKADLILLTHHHGDHLDSTALSKIYTEKTELYWTQNCEKNSKFPAKGKVVRIDDHIVTLGITIRAVPAYNIVNKRQNGEPYHIKGEGNGYILSINNLNIYIAGDTENIPEMANFGKIDIAFLPMSLPHTMTPEMVKEAVLMIKPKVLYPYHYGKTDTNIIVELLKDFKDIEVRVR